MPRFPVLSSREIVRIFEKLGWQVARRKGSHIIMTKIDHIATLSIPDHDPVAKGTLRSLIRSSGLTTEQFVKISKKK